MIPIILSGGEGKRLWPISTPHIPKQFADIFDEPLQAKTVRRLLPLGQPWTITTRNLQALTENINKRFKISSEQVLYEPFPRNTGPAVALLCAYFIKNNQAHQIVGIFPADHLITKTDIFLSACHLAEIWARKGKIVTLGIQPTFASTGYGYIEIDPIPHDQKQQLNIHRVKRFYEKPKADKAQEFIQSQCHFWNAGIFVFEVNTMWQALEKHMPQTWETVKHIDSKLENLEEIYQTLESKSIDYGVMEKTDNIFCIPVDMGWSDVGSWDEIARLTPPANSDSYLFTDRNRNFVRSVAGKKYVLIGVDDLIVVDSSDGLLICKKGESEKTKNAVETLYQGKIL